jgi:4-alpha-glucanotransferase
MPRLTWSLPPMPPTERRDPQPIRDALRLLGKRRMVLAIHDASFPSAEAEDLGRGSPYGRGARELARMACELGFDALQLGPQGQTSRANASPYDGTFFSRNVLSVDLFGLGEDPDWSPLLDRARLDAAVAENPRRWTARTAYRHAYDSVLSLLDLAWTRWREALQRGAPAARRLAAGLGAFRVQNRAWLEPDALYEALSASHGGAGFRDWPDEDERLLFRAEPTGRRASLRLELLERHADALERHAFGQWIVHEQHRRHRTVLREQGLALFGDLQVGSSQADAWARGDLYLAGYRMGAPPSRTNPEGQPWGYGVLDPAQYGAPGAEGAAAAFLRARIGKMLDECDGLRVDHPHGLVCPWVYRADDPSALHAVQSGARLFDSPALPDHPELATYAIVRPGQLDTRQPRYADGWVRELDGAQVERYAMLLDVVVGEHRARGHASEDLACEVLSTMPYPLGRVLARHGLGRFRVTQKADLGNPADVYRSENARPEDWVMAGTHDTPPLWRVVRGWTEAEAARQAAYLAGRLGTGQQREALQRGLAADRTKLLHAKVADLFVCPARNVVVFFADLFGVDEVYNAPGTVSDENWSLRLTPDLEARYAEAVLRGTALDLCAALAMALRARPELASAAPDLLRRLEGPAEPNP